MYIVGVLSLIILPFIFFDWHARMVFMAIAYPRRYGHGKSWNRAHKHYKTNWTFFQRLLWIPIFKEEYENKYRIIAYLSYTHATLTFVSVSFYLISIYNFPDSKIWVYEFLGYSVFWILRFVYDNAIAREKV